MASAAGLNTLATRERKMYLLRTAATEAMVVTYHGSCARRTIATIMAASTAPLGNSQAFFLARRISASTRPAAIVALASPDATARIPWPGAAMATRITRMMVSRPFGVLKNFLALRHMRQASRFVPLQLRRHDQPVHAHAIQELDAVFRAKHKCGRCQRIRQHRPGRDHGRARHGMG